MTKHWASCRPTSTLGTVTNTIDSTGLVFIAAGYYAILPWPERVLLIYRYSGVANTISVVAGKSFYSGGTVQVAKRLLGSYLVHNSPDGTTVGRIVETEAYLYRGDPACHASRGKTKRNAVMFGPAGYSYVYFVYGMYYCFNVVTGMEGEGEAVLVRALEPVEGVELMKCRRGTEDLFNLASGPAKLVLASGIKREHNGENLMTGALTIHSRQNRFGRYCRTRRESIVETTRIGISAGKRLKLRFYLEGNRFVSRL